MRKWMERNERGGLRGRRERGSEEKGEEGGRWVVRREMGSEEESKEGEKYRRGRRERGSEEVEGKEGGR